MEGKQLEPPRCLLVTADSSSSLNQSPKSQNPKSQGQSQREQQTKSSCDLAVVGPVAQVDSGRRKAWIPPLNYEIALGGEDIARSSCKWAW